MDIYRTFLAIILSFVILIGYQYFFVGFGPSEVSLEESAVQKESVATESSVPQKAAITATPATMSADVQSMVRPERDAQTIVVDTDLYTASLSEDGGSVWWTASQD